MLLVLDGAIAPAQGARWCGPGFIANASPVSRAARPDRTGSSIQLSTSSLLSEEGTALALPVKVHLENPLLGSSCYVGSNAHPVELPLTTGTTSPPAPNKPISGSAGELGFNEAFSLLTIKNNSLVNNSFAAPAAEGCGGLFSFLIDPLVDAKLGVPAAAGHNTAILNGTLKVASAEAVVASE